MSKIKVSGGCMKRKEWLSEVEKDCEFIVVVHGGSMCKEGGKRNFCDFHRCPKIELEKKED